MTITPEQLAEWARIEREATQGEWYVERGDSGYITSRVKCSECGDWKETTVGQMEEVFDATFATTSRDAMPLLIAEVQRLQQENERMRVALTVYADENNWEENGATNHDYRVFSGFTPAAWKHDDDPWYFAVEAIAPHPAAKDESEV